MTSLDNTATLEIENRDGGKWKYYELEYEGLREAASAYAAERGYAFSETTYSPFYYRWSAIKIALAVMVVFAVTYLLFPL